MHPGPSPAERQGDAAGADAELERTAFSGQLSQEVHRRVYHRGVEHARRGVVVTLRYLFIEIVLTHEGHCDRAPLGPPLVLGCRTTAPGPRRRSRAPRPFSFGDCSAASVVVVKRA